MQRGNLFLKLISAVVLIALICYLGIYIYNSASNPFKTALAVDYTVTRGYSAHGIIVRSEAVLPGSGDMTDTVAAEGKRVSAGGLLACEYSSESVRRDASEAAAVEQQIEQMEQVLKSAGSGTELLAIDTMAESLALGLQKTVTSREFSSLPKLTAEFRTLTYYSGDGSWDDAEAKLAELKNRLYSLRQSMSGGMSRIYSQQSGLFSKTVDGFEFLTPQALTELRASQLEGYLSVKYEPAESMGKLVSGVKWYFAALLDEDDAKSLREGATVRVRFDRYYGGELDMTVVRVGDRTQSGQAMAVLSCSKAMSEMISARKISGKIVTSSVSGIRVPKRAVKLDDEGRTCVYVLTGAQAERKYIEILEETGDYYVVYSDRESVSALRAGDEIIVSAKDLYDGKVVK